MNASAIRDVHLHEPLGECHLKEFSNTESSVNPYSSSFHMITYRTRKIIYPCTLICIAVQIKN